MRIINDPPEPQEDDQTNKPQGDGAQREGGAQEGEQQEEQKEGE